ncbi:MAG: hypothetical protein ACNI3C_00275 [Candidatus Marinarcus sp.]|uniref:hypothetical protein n=1 Tax=Candidatus Marinarcus sp. TaxID=3100987 RepID=UPI003B0091F4
MSKVILDVNEKELTTVLTILKSLKTGMIKNISVDKEQSSLKNKISTNKYLSKNDYNDKLNSTNVANKVSGSRYLSPQEFKERLNK